MTCPDFHSVEINSDDDNDAVNIMNNGGDLYTWVESGIGEADFTLTRKQFEAFVTQVRKLMDWK